jgi:pimeloyl-ACP methyl ester carboxylesterase
MSNSTVIDVEAPPYVEATLASGLRLGYVEQGAADAPPLILLHGFTDSWYSFSRVVPLLATRYRVIAVDQRGHGGSSYPQAPATLDDMAHDIVQLMSTLGIARASIAGHCMGSFVARRIAAIAPGRVNALILVAAAISPVNPTLTEFAKAVDMLEDPVDAEFAAAFQLGTVYGAVPPAFLERVIADSARVPARVWKEVFSGLLAYTPSEADIQAPTLVLGGDRDSVFAPAEQYAVAAQVRNAELRMLPDAGHSPHWENPVQFTLEVIGFLSSLPGA